MATKQEDGKADGKWAGSVTEVISAPVNKVWEILSDFDGIKKNFLQIFLSCEAKEGEENKVGSLRVVVVPMPDGTPFEAKETLLVLDNEKHIVSYAIEDNPFLIKYKTTFTADKHENDKTRAKWEFESNPNSLWTNSLWTEERFFPVICSRTNFQGSFVTRSEEAIIRGQKNWIFKAKKLREHRRETWALQMTVIRVIISVFSTSQLHLTSG